MFDAIAYFEDKNGKLKLTKGNYTFCKVSGLNNMEEVIQKMKSSTSFLAVDDTDDGMTVKRGGAWFNRRTVFIYILKKFKQQDQSDRKAKVEETLLVHKSLLSKLIIDKHNVAELQFFDDNRIPFHEVPGMFVAETCGIYFSITIEEPISLEYDASQWE